MAVVDACVWVVAIKANKQINRNFFIIKGVGIDSAIVSVFADKFNTRVKFQT